MNNSLAHAKLGKYRRHHEVTFHSEVKMIVFYWLALSDG